MPEGDSIFRAARTLHRAMAGRVVTKFESVYPALTRVAEDHPVEGRTIESVTSRGKHLLMTFSGDLVLHTHMRMNGSWHVYPAGSRWQRPLRDMRVVVATEKAVAVGFNIPVAELLTARDMARHKDLTALGPDVLGDVGHGEASQRFDTGEVIRRMRARERDAIGDVLLNQRVIAGIGNIFKSEILFLARVDPFRPVASLPDSLLDSILRIAREQLAANVKTASQTPTRTGGIRTTRSLNPNVNLWVYGRGGKPCRNCGAPIQARKTGVDARLTYWCPECQT
jgi:endonuclease VIII